MMTPAKTVSYRPSNGTEGELFMCAFCSRCERDRAHQQNPEAHDGCSIIADMFCFSIDDARYPKELVKDTDADCGLIGGSGARCTAFVEIGKELSYYCDKTADLFDADMPKAKP